MAKDVRVFCDGAPETTHGVAADDLLQEPSSKIIESMYRMIHLFSRLQVAADT